MAELLCKHGELGPGDAAPGRCCFVCFSSCFVTRTSSHRPPGPCLPWTLAMQGRGTVPRPSPALLQGPSLGSAVGGGAATPPCHGASPRQIRLRPSPGSRTGGESALGELRGAAPNLSGAGTFLVSWSEPGEVRSASLAEQAGEGPSSPQPRLQRRLIMAAAEEGRQPARFCNPRAHFSCSQLGSAQNLSSRWTKGL